MCFVCTICLYPLDESNEISTISEPHLPLHRVHLSGLIYRLMNGKMYFSKNSV